MCKTFGSGHSSHLPWQRSSLSQWWQNVAHFLNGDLQTQTHSQIKFSQGIPHIPALNGLQTPWKIQVVCTPYDHVFSILLRGMSNDNYCQPVSQMTRNYPQSQCYQDGRFLTYLVLLLMCNKMQKYLSFLQTIWLMEEMLLKFDTSVGGVARCSEGHNQSSKWTWSDRQMNRELVREMNRWISKRMFNAPTVTFRKESTNARWVLSAKQQYGRGSFRDECSNTLLVSSMVLKKNGNFTLGWSWILNSLVVLKVLYQYFCDKCLI